MKKSPCFPMYPSDFFGDPKVRMLSGKAMAFYAVLLMNIWEFDTQYSMPNDDTKIANLLKISIQEWIEVRDEVFSCLKHEKGRIVSPRLKREKQKQDKYRKSQSEKGKLGGRPTKAGGKPEESRSFPPVKPPNPIPNPIPNPNEENITILLSELLRDKITERNKKFKLPLITTWAKHIDLMIRIDNRLPEDIARVIEWCQGDPFWKNNILSTEKLRMQYDQLFMKMEEDQNGNRSGAFGSKRTPTQKAGRVESDGAEYPIDGEYG